jgi:hypothetical protein
MKRKHAEEEVKIYDQLKKRKIELQLECLKLKNRKMAFEIMDGKEAWSQTIQNNDAVLSKRITFVNFGYRHYYYLK